MFKKILLAILVLGAGFIVYNALQNPIPEEVLNACGRKVVEITNVTMPEQIKSACDNVEIKVTLTNLGDQTITQQDFDNQNYYFSFCKQDMCMETYSWYDAKLEAPIAHNEQGIVVLTRKADQPNGFEAFADSNDEYLVNFEHKTSDNSSIQCTIEDYIVKIDVAKGADSQEELQKCLK